MILGGALQSVKVTKHSKVQEGRQRTVWGPASRIIQLWIPGPTAQRAYIFGDHAVSRIGI